MFRASVGSALAIVLFPVLAASAQEQVESFDGGQFTNPFFNHELEFENCCWDFVRRQDDNDWVLHLRPNADLITFNLEPGQTVEAISVEVQDFEGGFTGRDPTSAVIVRGVDDFVALHTAELGTIEVLTADVNTLGRITGKPIGEIISLHFQAANEGNSEVPGIGAMFDDITITLRIGFVPGDLNCDGQLSAFDIEPFLIALFDPENYANQFPDCDINLADINADGSIDAFDIQPFLDLLFP